MPEPMGEDRQIKFFFEYDPAYPAQRIVRRIQVGVLLSLEQAESTADFIKSRVADFRAKRDAQGPPEGRR